jgi:hypothetical protein
MTLKDIQKLPVHQTAAVGFAGEDPETHNYIVDCLLDLYGGNYGSVPADDTAANNADLLAGEGHILARYPMKHKLTNDIYINAVFSATMPGLDSNNIMVMYVDEY